MPRISDPELSFSFVKCFYINANPSSFQNTFAYVRLHWFHNSPVKLLNYRHFRNEETKAQRGHMTLWKSHRKEDISNLSTPRSMLLSQSFLGPMEEMKVECSISYLSQGLPQTLDIKVYLTALS